MNCQAYSDRPWPSAPNRAGGALHLLAVAMSLVRRRAFGTFRRQSTGRLSAARSLRSNLFAVCLVPLKHDLTLAI